MTMPATGTEEPTEVSCVILPLRNRELLVPAACVAEVLPWRPMTARPDAPATTPGWYLGEIDWHEEAVPVADFECLCGAAAPPSGATGRCLVVMNRVTPAGLRPFYALAVAVMPRLVQLAQIDVVAEEPPGAAAEALRVRVGTELVVIPDLAYLEEQLAAQGIPGA
jgi:chemosensory pili system protein ChpC